MITQQLMDELIGHAPSTKIAGLEFRLLASSDYLSTSKQHMPLHRHSWYSLILTSIGSSSHSFPDCESTIQKNDLLFIPPGILHSWTSMELPLRMRGIIFEVHSDRIPREQLSSLLGDAARDKCYHYALPDTDLMAISNTLFESTSVASNLLVESVLSLIRRFLVIGLQNSVGAVLESVRVAPAASERSHAERVVHRAQSHIYANLDQPLTREDVAHHVHFSLRHLDRIFHEQAGTSLGSFIREAKLERAKTLLCRSKLSIKEIAYAVGYREEASFYRMIHRELGMSPARYRGRQPPVAGE